ncbi:hypothetical protein IWX46DRAFT_596668 [Phyllosticta citricarpa]|uniref:Secreted protein n=1 Tax=Phyllosticta citricarpa TaxID=55181 RepID=A0ABR1MJH5_9PEZI
MASLWWSWCAPVPFKPCTVFACFAGNVSYVQNQQSKTPTQISTSSANEASRYEVKATSNSTLCTIALTTWAVRDGQVPRQDRISVTPVRPLDP